MAESRLFREPEEDFDVLSDDVLVGGMASMADDIILARSYAWAASRLIQPAIESGEPWMNANPILFLFRHALELYLKAIVRPAKPSHHLDVLINELETVLKDSNRRLSPQTKISLLKFASIDPDSQGFRYVTRHDGRPMILEGEYVVSLTELDEFFSGFLRNLDDFFHSPKGVL